MDEQKKNLNVGKDAVVMGDVTGNVGDRSVVIRATDNRGNVILNQQMAVGYSAQAGPESIAIGAFAGAGAANLPTVADLIIQIEKLKESLDLSMERASEFQGLLDQFQVMNSEPQPDKSRMSKILNSLRSIAESAGGSGILEIIKILLSQL